ncbi:Cobalt-zinc-cadmium resistance protein CzcC precursor [compost metagenome]
MNFRMPGRIAPILLAFAIGLAGNAAASGEGSVTFEQALHTAFSSNPDFAAAAFEPAIAEGGRRQAGLMPNPELSWEAEDTRADSRTTTVMLAQPIELGGKRGARIDVATWGQNAADVELQRKRNVLRAEVIQSFYGALLAQQRLALAEESEALAERGLAVAEGRSRAGTSSPVEATRARVQLSEVRLELQRASMQRANAYQQLASSMGQSGSAFGDVKGVDRWLPRLPATDALLARIGETADLRLATIQIDEREAILGLKRAQRIPDLTVSIGSQYDAETKDRVNVVGLSMPIPLFDRNQGNVLAAARRADQARDLRRATELRLQGEVRQALEQWATALGAIDSYDRLILPAARDAVGSATRGFEMGKFAFLDVLDAQRTLIAARSQYIQAMSDALESWARIERIFGDLGAFEGR